MKKSFLIGFILIGLAAEVIAIVSIVKLFGAVTVATIFELALALFIAGVADYIAAKEIIRRKNTTNSYSSYDEDDDWYDEERDYYDENGYDEDYDEGMVDEGEPSFEEEYAYDEKECDESCECNSDCARCDNCTCDKE